MLFLITLIEGFRQLAKRATFEEAGQSMVEYALILAVVSIAAVASLILLAPQITNAIDAVTAAFP